MKCNKPQRADLGSEGHCNSDYKEILRNCHWHRTGKYEPPSPYTLPIHKNRKSIVCSIFETLAARQRNITASRLAILYHRKRERADATWQIFGAEAGPEQEF